jgi:hypothetical protein
MRVLILPVLMLLATCGSEPRNESTGGEAAPDLGANTAEALHPAPAATGAASPPPRDIALPEFAPRYPGSTLAAVVPAATEGGSHEVRLTTSDAADAVMVFYRDRFAAAGLRKTSDFLSGGTGMMSAIGAGRKAAIAITKEADHTAIILTYSGK